MTRFKQWLITSLFSAALVACGGGGGGDPADTTGPAASTAPPISGAATAVLSPTAQTASAVVTAARDGASAAEKVDGFSGLPLGVQVAPATGVVTTETVACSGGGNSTITTDTAAANAVAAGDTLRMSFSQCVEPPVTFSGTVLARITRYANENSFAFTFEAQNLTMSGAGLDRGPFSFSGQADYSPAGVSFAYMVDDSTVVGAPSVARDGNTVVVNQATTRSKLGSGSGFVEVTFSGWTFDRRTGRPSAGTARISAANGDSATITVTGTGYQVVLVVGGASTSHLVPF